MSSTASIIHQSLLRKFLKQKQNSSLEETVQWFRDLNVKNPKPLHVNFCHLEERTLGHTRFFILQPPRLSSDKILFYLHGGSYAGGPHLLHWQLISRLARRLGCRAVVVDYKLTPEYAYPVALLESLAVYTHLRTIKPGAEFIFIGDSAGGGLALAASLKLKMEGGPLPGKLVLISPWLDVSLQNPAIDAYEAREVMLDRKGVQQIGQAYAGVYPLDHPYISPLYGNLEGLPPVLLTIGTEEIFLPDCDKFCLKAQEAQLEVECLRLKGLFHDWPIFPFMPETSLVLKAITRFAERPAVAPRPQKSRMPLL
jgi:epsilon-lactone hydrolase